MKKYLILILFFCFTNFITAQKLDLNLLDKLPKLLTTTRSFDELMTEGYGFTKVKNNKDDDIRTRNYKRVYDNNHKKTMKIRIKYVDDKPNQIDILLGSAYDIREVKDELLLRGYEYNGIINSCFVYKTEKTMYIISKPNYAEVTQIMVSTEW